MISVNRSFDDQTLKSLRTLDTFLSQFEFISPMTNRVTPMGIKVEMTLKLDYSRKFDGKQVLLSYSIFIFQALKMIQFDTYLFVTFRNNDDYLSMNGKSIKLNFLIN